MVYRAANDGLGSGMKAHYRNLFRLVQTGKYFHIGRKPLYKSYGYVSNVVFQLVQLLSAKREAAHSRVFYVADYEPICLQHWLDCLQESFGVKPLRTLSRSLAKPLAVVGDLINQIGFRRFPFNSFRLRNILTEYCFDMTRTKAICGSLPYSFEEGVGATADWYLGLSGRKNEDIFYP